MNPVMLKKWEKRKIDMKKAKEIQDRFQTSSLMAAILSIRPFESFEEIEKFLQPKMGNFYDPFLFQDMTKAKERVLKAIETEEKIVIYGDYDADGITSTAILVRAIRDLGGKVDYYIPNRFIEGYGPNQEAFKKIAADGCTLLITVDNGIAATKEMHYAKQIGMDVILTDHHAYQEEVPEVYATIHPKNPKDHYPFPELCGAGVALKFAHALHGKMHDAWIELATIGTICDLMPLLDENRVIVKNGLQRMMMTKLAGLRMMFKARKIELHTIETDTIGFIIGPRLNAIGRLYHAKEAVELLITDDEQYALELVERLEDFNQQRKAIVEQITEEAMIQAKEQMDKASLAFLVLANPDWNPGVVGIVASKIVTHFGRPTIVLGGSDENTLKGSGRSIEAFHIFEGLSQVSEHLLHFGGHKMAAGLALEIGQLEAFRTAIDEIARQCLTDDDFIPRITVDYSGNIGEFTVATIKELEKLAPFGSGNPRPIIGVENVSLKEARTIGSAAKHLRVVINDANHVLSCVGFHFGSYEQHLKNQKYVSLAGTLNLNEWNYKVTPQLRLEDIQLMKQKNIVKMNQETMDVKSIQQASRIFANRKQYKRYQFEFGQDQEIFFIGEMNSNDQITCSYETVVIAADLTEYANDFPTIVSDAHSFVIFPFWNEIVEKLHVERKDFENLYKKLREHGIITSRETLKLIGNEVNIEFC